MEGADILVNLDADNYTEEGFAKYIREIVGNDHEKFLWAKMIPGVMDKGISGRIIVTKSQFYCAGGYDEIYEKYSPDDKDFRARLIRLGYEPIEIDPKFLKAVRHNDKMRFKEYPEVKGNVTEDFYINQTNRIRNYGRAGLGTVWKNFQDDPIEVKPFPTRIFGIGMHKTATTSLHHAMEMLGFKSGHWKNAHWAKAIWREMNEDGGSKTLESCYSLCDLPIPLLYKQLDEAYPGSKFILTIRDEESWLKSVRNHYDPEKNINQKSWKKDPFTNIIHRELYGTTQFDPEIALRVYRNHNKSVIEYFSDRPEDLVILDLAEGKEWEKICDVLDMPVPNVPYPVKNPTKKKTGNCFVRMFLKFIKWVLSFFTMNCSKNKQ
jgi:hypothetical protein